MTSRQSLRTRGILPRLAWHLARIRSQIDRRVVFRLLGSILAFVVLSALLVTLIEKEWTASAFADSFYWAVNSVLGASDPDYVSSPLGWIISWLLIILGLTLLAVATGLLIGFIVDVLFREGQGMGAAGYRNHVVVCGWNSSARALVDELQRDEYGAKVVVLDRAEKNPAGKGVYFVSGDATDEADLQRAAITEAAAAIVVPHDLSDEADMRSILVVMAIESVAPNIRTIVAVNNRKHFDHLKRAHADELLAPAELASHLLARASLYPGLTELVVDIVSGGDGSELYRVEIPDDYVGRSVDEVSSLFRREHRATLVSIGRGGTTHLNPRADFSLERGDEALVIAESLGRLTPIKLENA